MITGVVLARNEESQIVECLQAFRPYVNELILIDMESTDSTVSHARTLADSILSHPLIPNFDSARNIAIDVARYDWIWFVDADERVPAETGRLINNLVRERGKDFDAITIPFKTYFAGRWIQHSGWWPGYTMPRVLRRGRFRFAERLHGGVQVEGPELRIAPLENLAVDHFSYRDITHYVEKFNRYTTTESLNLAADHVPLDWERASRAMVRDLWLYYECNGGHGDGIHGWILAWLAGQYRWFSHAKLLDQANPATIDSASIPRSLDEFLCVFNDELAKCRRGLDHEVGIHFRSPLLDPSGYADDGRRILGSLALLERDLSAENIPWSDVTCELAPGERSLICALMRRQPGYRPITITNCIPTLCGVDQTAQCNILRTTFETDRVPEQWLPILAQFDEIWVCSQFNARVFRQSWVPPERIRVVNQSVDTSVFTPYGERCELPPTAAGRFVFLSIFDWQLRKGWDLLLRAYCSEFSLADNTALLLKISRGHGHTMDGIHRDVARILEELGQTLEQRTDIVLWDACLPQSQLAALYRSVDAFALASRGEGWGRPWMEAMASGLPTIGSAGSGNDDFMTAENSFLVPTTSVPVSEAAALEIPPYRGHRWLEPDEASLRHQLRQVHCDRERTRIVGQQARQDIVARFSPQAAAKTLDNVIGELVSARQPHQLEPMIPGQIEVQLEGEFFANHSFANINESLARHWLRDTSLALSLRRLVQQPTQAGGDSERELTPYFSRCSDSAKQVVVRHAFPPNWTPPEKGRWVHIQPWEFGYLPIDWIPPLRDLVDEIWVPSNYVRDVYLRSGIPPHKVQVMPWGIEPDVYTPAAPPLHLPTSKQFRFLFVGGTIERKGFDVLLEAYIQEFKRGEDVCLVVKDIGVNTFYRFGNHRDRIQEVIASGSGPEMLYYDQELSDGLRASLYTACHCVVAPYRGEGFGLPILEGMACGLPAIVPRGGPTDDFTSEETAFYLHAREVECHHDWPLYGPARQLSVEVSDVRQAMRDAFENSPVTKRKGEAARLKAQSEYSWEVAARRMSHRLRYLAQEEHVRRPAPNLVGCTNQELEIIAGVIFEGSYQSLPGCLARIRPFVRDTIIVCQKPHPEVAAIAEEYNARILVMHPSQAGFAEQLLGKHKLPWLLLLTHQHWLDERAWHSIEQTVQASQKLSSGVSSLDPEGREIPEASQARLMPATQVIDSELIAAIEQLGLSTYSRVSPPQTNDSQLTMALDHFRQGNYFHAEVYLTESLAHYAPGTKQRLQILRCLATCHREMGDSYRAREFTALLNSLQPGDREEDAA